VTTKNINLNQFTALLPVVASRIRHNYAAYDMFFPAYGSPTLDGAYKLTANQNWLAAFWAGLLWLVANHDGDPDDVHHATSLLPSFIKRLNDNTRLNHDLGFLFTLSARAQWQYTADPIAYKTAIRAADVLLGRFRPTGKFIQAWDDEDNRDERGRFIIDCMMNLPLLYWASRETGQPEYAQAATAHAHTSARYLLSDDGSSYHTFYLNADTGEPIGPKTHQGYADDSLWSRGQGWAIYGFTMAYEWTQEPTFLQAAQSAAHRYLAEVTSDAIAPWDFRLPADATAYPDSSADAIAAGGLLRLAKATDDPTYRKNAESRLRVLIEKAFDTRSGVQGLLLHGSQHVPHGYGVDTYTIFGDFFFLEAVMTLLNAAPDFWGPHAK
jgi:unsaturated chondroitin disaccharide hydrolase